MDVEYLILGSGSKGNSSVIKFDGHALMIDAGFSGKELHRRLDSLKVNSDKIDGILVTHEHNDHINGLRVFSDRNNKIPVYANLLTAERLHHLKKRPENLTLFNNGCPFEIGPFKVEAFSISHDAADPVGFVIEVADRRIAVVTDCGHAGKMVPLKIRDCHVLMIESNHDPILLRQSRRPPHLQHRILGRRGHLSNDSSAELIAKCLGPATRHIVLSHLSEDCNREELALETMQACLDQHKRTDVELSAARQAHVHAPLAL